MKTGKVAKLFGIDPKTVTGWVDEFAEFFSDAAKGEGSTQREYLPEDLIVLNTIKVERVKRSETEQIRAVLASGHREVNLPPQATVIGGDAAITVYAQMKELEVKLDLAEAEIDRLRNDGKEKDEKIDRLNREIGKWQTRYEILQEKQDDDK
jgi:DNA-binding transcriptional MerR regulator